MSYEYKKKYNERYAKTKKGLSATIFTSQRRRSKIRGHPEPSFNLDEFRNWLFSSDNFNMLYDNWKKSGYNKFLKPSVDRIDNSIGYEISNMRICTWQENDDNGKVDKEKSILCYSLDGVFIDKFDSITKASFELNINRRSINNALTGFSKTAGGYKWVYQH